MIKVVLLSLLLSVSVAPSKVFVCMGGGGEKYHAYQNCRGLNRCTHSIKGMTVSEAKQLGKTPCKICH